MDERMVSGKPLQQKSRSLCIGLYNYPCKLRVNMKFEKKSRGTKITVHNVIYYHLFMSCCRTIKV